MRFLFPIAISFLLQAASLADSFQLEGTAVKTEASISWKGITNRLPETVQVFKVLPQTFTKEQINHAMELAAFTPLTMKMSKDKKTMQWSYNDQNGTLQRGLSICPSGGWVSLFNYQTGQKGTKASEGVPTFDRVDALAQEYWHRFGGDTNQLPMHTRYRTDEKRELYQGRNGPQILEDITKRGCMYPREIDGITFTGKASRGGLWMEFGANEKVAKLELVLRNLQPERKYRVASFRQMEKFIEQGKATLPEQDFDPHSFEQASKILVEKLTLSYWGGPPGEQGSLSFPFAELRLKVSFDDGSSQVCILYCPILTDPISEK